MLARCLCEEIEFEFDALDHTAINCHCSLCRRSHGAAFATHLLSSKCSLRLRKGAAYLKEYKTAQGKRAFCSHCGSRLMNYAADDSDFLSVALAAVVDSHAIRPKAHAFVNSKAAWHEPGGNIPAYDGYVPQALEPLQEAEGP